MTDKQIELYLAQISRTSEDFQKEKELLQIRFGGEPKDADVMWALINKCILGLNESDLDSLRIHYLTMADFVYEINNSDPMEFLSQAIRTNLLQLKELYYSYPAVQVMCPHASHCRKAKELKGKVFTIDEALNTMPIPNRECEYRWDEHKKFSFCTCSYMPLDNDEYNERK